MGMDPKAMRSPCVHLLLFLWVCSLANSAPVPNSTTTLPVSSQQPSSSPTSLVFASTQLSSTTRLSTPKSENQSLLIQTIANSSLESQSSSASNSSSNSKASGSSLTTVISNSNASSTLSASSTATTSTTSVTSISTNATSTSATSTTIKLAPVTTAAKKIDPIKPGINPADKKDTPNIPAQVNEPPLESGDEAGQDGEPKDDEDDMEHDRKPAADEDENGGRLSGGGPPGPSYKGFPKDHKEWPANQSAQRRVETESNRLGYFVMFLVASVAVLFAWKRRQRILAYVIEGRRSHGRRRAQGPQAHYRKLRNEGEDEKQS